MTRAGPTEDRMVLDGGVVQARRQGLGLTESRLGQLCGASAGTIRRLESGWDQGDLSLRFVALLSEHLAAPVAELVVRSAPDGRPPTEPAGAQSPAAQLGALLQAAGEPVPIEAICELFNWTTTDLDDAAAELHRLLEHVGGVLVDSCDTLTIAADVGPVTVEEAGAAMAAAFVVRRPTSAELRVVHRLLTRDVVRREDLDTAQGRIIGRFRSIGILNPAGKVDMKVDPPELSDDVKFSLMVPAATHAGL